MRCKSAVAAASVCCPSATTLIYVVSNQLPICYHMSLRQTRHRRNKTSDDCDGQANCCAHSTTLLHLQFVTNVKCGRSFGEAAKQSLLCSSAATASSRRFYSTALAVAGFCKMICGLKQNRILVDTTTYSLAPTSLNSSLLRLFKLCCNACASYVSHTSPLPS